MLYIYEALEEKTKKIIRGEIDVSDKLAVSQYLAEKNLVPVLIMEKIELGKVELPSIFERVTHQDKIILTKYLSAVLSSGMNLREAFDVLLEDTTKRILRKILIEAKRNLEQGLPLSKTFESYPKYFSPVFVGVIKAGEASGTLDKSLNILGDQLIRDYELLSRIRGAMIYPLILIFSSLGVILLLITFVFPRLIKVFEEGGFKLPLITKIVIEITKILASIPFLTLGLFLFIVLFLFFFSRSSLGKKFWTNLLFNSPFLKDLIKKIALVQFTRSLKNLLASGVAIVDSLNITANAIGYEIYKQAIFKSLEDLKKGIPLTDVLKKYPQLFPKLLLGMIKIGERSGTLEKTLETLSNFYSEEVDRKLKNLVSLIEPIILIVLGLIIGGLALVILLPIYQLIGALR